MRQVDDHSCAVGYYMPFQNDDDSRTLEFRPVAAGLDMHYAERLSGVVASQLREHPGDQLALYQQTVRLLLDEGYADARSGYPALGAADPGGEALVSAEALRDHLPAFTACLILWLAKQTNDGMLSNELAHRFEQNAKGYRNKLAAKLGRQANTGRMIGNWAVLVTVYQMLACFWEEMGVEEPLKPWQDAIFETVQRVQQERASDGFIQALNELLASGEAVLTQTKVSEEPRPGATIVGYEDGAYIYLLPEISYR